MAVIKNWHKMIGKGGHLEGAKVSELEISEIAGSLYPRPLDSEPYGPRSIEGIRITIQDERHHRELDLFLSVIEAEKLSQACTALIEKYRRTGNMGGK